MRRLALILATLLVAALIALATSPWWFGVALRGAGKKWGARFEHYERLSYSRFALSRVEYQRRRVTVAVERIESDTPPVWLWHRLTGHPGMIKGGEWSVTVAPYRPSTTSPVASGPAPSYGWLRLRGQLQRIAGKLERWMPLAEAGRGVVRWPGQELRFGSARWQSRRLRVVGFGWKQLQTDAALEFPQGVDELRLRMADAEAGAILSLQSRGREVSGELAWREQRAPIQSVFRNEGWVPATASLAIAEWHLPPGDGAWAENYAELRTNGRVEWNDGVFKLEATAAMLPKAGASVPPMNGQVRLHRETGRFSVDALDVALPGLTAKLSEPVSVGMRGSLGTGAAHFRFEADLAKQSWIDAKGTVQGDAYVTTTSTREPIVEFWFSAKDVNVASRSISDATISGRLNWPRFTLASATLSFGPKTRLTASGRADLARKEIEALQMSGTVDRAEIGTWLPATLGWTSAEFSAKARGPIARLEHEGEASVRDFTAARVLKPVQAKLQWQGVGPALTDAQVMVIAGESSIDARGAVDARGAKLSALKFTQEGREVFALTQPATVRWRDGVRVEGLKLKGESATVELDGQWGANARVDAELRNATSIWARDFAQTVGPAWTLQTLSLHGANAEGVFEFKAQARSTIDLDRQRAATVQASLHGTKDGVTIDSIDVLDGQDSVVRAQGAVPLAIRPGDPSPAKFARDKPLSLTIATTPESVFWSRLSELTGVVLERPNASLQVHGTWEKPEGRLAVTAARVQLNVGKLRNKLPEITDLRLNAAAARNEVRVETLQARLDGQEVRITGRLPVKAMEDWSKLRAHPLAFLRRGAEGSFVIPGADLAAIAAHVPTLIATKGKLQADIAVQPGENISGFVRVSGASTRPIGSIGAIQDIDAELRLTDQTITVVSATGHLGGQPVTLAGKATWPSEEIIPDYDLMLKGKNFPFIRRAGLLVRGDVDLKLSSTGRAPPKIAGTVVLRDSLFLSDVSSLLPHGGPKAAAQRPPYFAVERAPFNTWGLAVDIRGDRFMRMRTALFSGVISSRLKLAGTLGEPEATGDVVVNEGQVRLPFASFAVQEGRVRLSPGRAVEPQISLTGKSQRYDYDLRMEVTGPVSAPRVVFSSTPPLDSQQVLLMVMAGEVPKNPTNMGSSQRFARLGAFIGQSFVNDFDAEPGAPDRLTITSGERISTLGRETYDIEYTLTDRWSLIGEYDEFDDYNAGVKWRLFPGDKKKADEKK